MLFLPGSRRRPLVLASLLGLRFDRRLDLASDFLGRIPTGAGVSIQRLELFGFICANQFGFISFAPLFHVINLLRTFGESMGLNRQAKCPGDLEPKISYLCWLAFGPEAAEGSRPSDRSHGKSG